MAVAGAFRGRTIAAGSPRRNTSHGVGSRGVKAKGAPDQWTSRLLPSYTHTHTPALPCHILNNIPLSYSLSHERHYNKYTCNVFVCLFVCICISFKLLSKPHNTFFWQTPLPSVWSFHWNLSFPANQSGALRPCWQLAMFVCCAMHPLTCQRFPQCIISDWHNTSLNCMRSALIRRHLGYFTTNVLLCVGGLAMLSRI